MNSLDAYKDIFTNDEERNQSFTLILRKWIQSTELNKYEFISYGKMNVVYRLYFNTNQSKIKKSVILRIRYFNDPDFNQDFCTESKLFALFNDHYVHYPKVYFIDNEKNIIPYLYSLIEDILGTILGQNNTISDYYNIGKALFKVHEIKSNYFGQIGGNSNILNANDYYKIFYRSGVALIRKYDVNLCEKFNCLYKEKYNSQYMESMHPSLLHGDFHPGNIIMKTDTLPIFIDWESARFGIKEYDFIKMKYFLFNRLDNDKLLSFMEGYSSWNNININCNYLIFELCWLIRMYIFDSKYTNPSIIYPPKELYYKNIQNILFHFDDILEQYKQNRINIWKGCM